MRPHDVPDIEAEETVGVDDQIRVLLPSATPARGSARRFEPYYGHTEATPSDPNVLFDAAAAVRAFDVITDQELAQFTQAWAALQEVEENKRHAVLSTSTQCAYDIAGLLLFPWVV
jgi:hypothetical protein